MRDRAGVPVRRILAESLVIVCSILLALAVDAWWDGVQERNLERAYLEALSAELEASRFELDADLEFRRRALTSIDRLLGVIDGTAPAMPTDSLRRVVGGLRYSRKFSPTQSALNELVASGRTNLIRSTEIRGLLFAYATEIEKSRIEEEQEREHIAQEFTPFLMRHIPLRFADELGLHTADELGLQTMTLVSRTPAPDEMPAEIAARFADLLEVADFESALAARRERAALATFRQESVGQLLDAARTAIDQELR